MNPLSNEAMQRIPSLSSPAFADHQSFSSDPRWTEKEQQHLLAQLHPRKSTIRVNSYGVRHKFDGKEWRALCTAIDAYECRNLAFRASLCQKHFYKFQRGKRSYHKSESQTQPASDTPSVSSVQPASRFQRPIERQSFDGKRECTIEEDDSIEIVESSEYKSFKLDGYDEPPRDEANREFGYFTVDHSESFDPYHRRRSIPSPARGQLESHNREHGKSAASFSVPKVTESIRLGLPPLTRTEEKSLATELIMQLPHDTSLVVAEQIARQRACDIVTDNYPQQFLPMKITGEWFYDFLLRNPRVPIHFQSWFASVKATMPSSDQTIDIKIWELGLVTRSIMSASSPYSTSSSPH